MSEQILPFPPCEVLKSLPYCEYMHAASYLKNWQRITEGRDESAVQKRLARKKALGLEGNSYNIW